MMETGVFLSLGSNQGDRQRMLEQARVLLVQSGIEILSASGIYETEPWGNPDQNLFLNQILGVRTNLDPSPLLDTLLKTEQSLGRKRGTQRWQERTIDIDLLFYNDVVLKTAGLEVPHPHLHKRRFILQPLAEIAPDYIHPGLQKSIARLLAECSDTLEARLIGEKEKS